MRDKISTYNRHELNSKGLELKTLKYLVVSFRNKIFSFFCKSIIQYVNEKPVQKYILFIVYLEDRYIGIHEKENLNKIFEAQVPRK